MLFCVDTGAPHSCIGEKIFERIVHHSGCRSFPIIDSKHNFKFGDTLVRSRSILELMLPTPESTLLGLEVLDGNNLLVNNLTNHLWNRIITNKDPLRFEDMWKIKFIRKGDYPCVSLSRLIQLFFTIAQLQYFHKQFAHQSVTKLYDLPKTV